MEIRVEGAINGNEMKASASFQSRRLQKEQRYLLEQPFPGAVELRFRVSARVAKTHSFGDPMSSDSFRSVATVNERSSTREIETGKLNKLLVWFVRYRRDKSM